MKKIAELWNRHGWMLLILIATAGILTIAANVVDDYRELKRLRIAIEQYGIVVEK